MLFPPYGNAGNENFMLIQPKAASETASGGGTSTTVWVVIGVVVVAVVVLRLCHRRPRTEEM